MTIDPKNLSATATLTFSDEFNSLSLWNGTSGTWSTKYPFAPEKGGSLPSNGEQEWYINSTYAPTTSVRPWTVSNGVLTLTAQPATASVQPLIDGYQYTSGMINTYNSFTQTYGYFEMRAQLPAGQGLWPAFWLLEADMSWPPEIDVMEVLGHDMTTLYTAAHTLETGSHTSKGGTIKVPNMSQGYHTYGVDWQADYISYYFDGEQVWRTPTPSDMNEPMYMIANLAVGGYWPGMVNGTTPFPAQMKIDYIRAYADDGAAPPPSNPPPANPPPANPPPVVDPDPSDRPRGSRRDDRPDDRDGSDTVRGPRRDDRPDDSDGSDTVRGPRRDDRHDGPRRHDANDDGDGSDTNRGPRRDDRPDDSDGSDSIRVSQRDDTHDRTPAANRTDDRGRSDTDRSSDNGDGNDARVLMDGAGSDTFTFNEKAFAQGDRIADLNLGTDLLDLRRGTDSADDGYLSFPSDGAGDTEVHFDLDQSPWMSVQPTGVNMQADWFVH